MLVTLSIENVVLIEKLTIEFRSGLCVLTGETGAGKSILLDALGLALGARSESGLVRAGADQASVIAEFSVPKSHSSFMILKEAGFAASSELLLRRVISPDGRSRAFINDQPVSASLLRAVGESLMEVHGQFETQGLLNPTTHRTILDEYAGLDTKTPDLWAQWRQAESDVGRMKQEAAQSRAEEEYLRQAMEDLDGLDPQPGEEKTMSEQRERLMHREKVMVALNAAYELLSREDDPVRAAWATLDKVSDRMGSAGEATISALQRASAEIEEAIAQIQSASSDLEHNDQSLESIDDRLHALRAQARKHQCTVDDLADKRRMLAERLNLIERGDDLIELRMKEAAKARNAYEVSAKADSSVRQKAAKKLDGLVQRELPPLKMDKARFVTEIEQLTEAEWGPHGWDKVRFLVATNPGSAPGPLNKIASGGEMARFMLALKVVMAQKDESANEGQSLIFDEVDSGIGGATADAVGERLYKLARTRQVLVVTHAPQVAARANHHYIVRKEGTKQIKTSVIELNKNTERREEIARMLAGATITKEARAAADQLLKTGT
jgi:DNA repair protein RecN (Recombination protein N)